MGEDRQTGAGGRLVAHLSRPLCQLCGHEGGRRLQNLHGGEEFALNGGRRFDGRNGQTSERPPRRSYSQARVNTFKWLQQSRRRVHCENCSAARWHSPIDCATDRRLQPEPPVRARLKLRSVLTRHVAAVHLSPGASSVRWSICIHISWLICMPAQTRPGGRAGRLSPLTNRPASDWLFILMSEHSKTVSDPRRGGAPRPKL